MEAIPFAALEGFAGDDHQAAFAVFAASCRALVENDPPLRPAVGPPAALAALCRKALAEPPRGASEARRFFETHFRAYRIQPDTSDKEGFLTGYYEPVVEGALARDADFSAPLLGRPGDLAALKQGEHLTGPDSLLQAARAGAAGLEPYPDRAAIEAGALDGRAYPLVWVRDRVEAYFIHVQGSARIKLCDGSEMRLTYAGRNGHPYTSIGRILIEDEKVPAEKAGLTGLKQWIRDHGQMPGERGGALMARNKSYIFFAMTPVLGQKTGPMGGQNLNLTALRSIAVDRSLWSYGLPFWIDAELPWRSARTERFRRLMIAQDTGSAIVGAARADLFFGSGDEAGALAGAIRHPASFTVLLPRDLDEPS